MSMQNNIKKKIVYVVGGLYAPSGMCQILSQKINWLAAHTDYEIYMILTEKENHPFYYEISPKVKFVNFNINFDELDTMALPHKMWHYRKKQRLYKVKFTEYIHSIRPDILVSAIRREINFINRIPCAGKKIGEIHFNRSNYRQINYRFFPKYVNRLISDLWMKQLIKELKRLDAFVVLSEEDKLEWKELTNVQVIYNSIRIPPKEKSNCSSKKVIAVGRYTWQKGFDLLVQSWKIVESKNPEWSLHLYGSGDYHFYQDMAYKEGLKNIHFHAATHDIYKKYIESSIFVFSSRYEGFGLALAEAMSCGLPAVSFACPCGPKDIITNNSNGFLVDKEDTNQMAEKICFLIENENTRINMGLKAQEIVKRFSEATIMQKWCKLLNGIL